LRIKEVVEGNLGKSLISLLFFYTLLSETFCSISRSPNGRGGLEVSEEQVESYCRYFGKDMEKVMEGTSSSSFQFRGDCMGKIYACRSYTIYAG